MKKLIALLALCLSFSAQAATLYGTQATKWQNSTPAQLASQGSQGGIIKHCTDSYVVSADLSTSDVILLCKIPQGATVIDARMINPAMSAGTINLGYVASADGSIAANSTAFMSAVSVTSAGVYSMFTSNSTGVGSYKTFDQPVQVKATIGTDTTATSGTFIFDILYYVD